MKKKKKRRKKKKKKKKTRARIRRRLQSRKMGAWLYLPQILWTKTTKESDDDFSNTSHVTIAESTPSSSRSFQQEVKKK